VGGEGSEGGLDVLVAVEVAEEGVLVLGDLLVVLPVVAELVLVWLRAHWLSPWGLVVVLALFPVEAIVLAVVVLPFKGLIAQLVFLVRVVRAGLCRLGLFLRALPHPCRLALGLGGFGVVFVVAELIVVWQDVVSLDIIKVEIGEVHVVVGVGLCALEDRILLSGQLVLVHLIDK
jgi:hypothetical protein